MDISNKIKDSIHNKNRSMEYKFKIHTEMPHAHLKDLIVVSKFKERCGKTLNTILGFYILISDLVRYI